VLVVSINGQIAAGIVSPEVDSLMMILERLLEKPGGGL
jgi:hypothetical protein